MANLSNINNVLRVSSNLRVGINTDAASYALEIGGTNSGIKLKNSGASGRVYSLLSDTSGNFQIYDDAAASGRLVISSGGNATFAAKVFSTSTVSGDTGTTLVTKDYVDSSSGSSINTILVTAVAVAGQGNRYFLDGVQQANAVLQPGFTYRFDQSATTPSPGNGPHPLRFSITPDGTHNSGVEYTTGVTVVGTPGSAGAYTQIITTQATPVTLYYYCIYHSGMGGAATIRIIKTDGNATFAGDITLGDDLNFTTNGFADISNTGTGAMRFKPSGQTLALTLTGANSTFAGTINSDNITVGKADGNNSSISLTANTGNWTFTNVQASRNLEISDSDGTGTVMTINTSGNVMMGKNSQSSNAALTIKSMAGGNTGIILVEGDTTNDGHGLYATTDNKFVITRYTNGGFSDNFVMDSSGNVGIGTTSPSTKLQVNGTTAIINSAAELWLGDSLGGGDGGFIKWNSGSDYLYIGNSYNSAYNTNIVIANTGNVGIGTTSPRAVGSGYRGLEVSSPSSGSSLWLSGFTDTTKGYLAMDTGGLNLTAITNHPLIFGTNNSPKMRINSSGTVGIGIGATAGAKLHVVDTAFPQVRINDDTGAGESGIRIRSYNGSTNDLHGDIFVDASSGIENGRMGFRIPWNGNERLTILSSGNVGIGVTNPAAKLHVSGTSTQLMLETPNRTNDIDFRFRENGSNKWNIRYQSAIGKENLQILNQIGPTIVQMHFEGSNNRVGVGTDSPTGNLTSEASGNQLHLRANTSTSGKFWNFDIDSNNRLYIVTQPPATGVYMNDGATSWTGTSDESVKENIKPLEDVLEKIKDYRCIEYNLKIDKNKGKKIGFIAQDWKNDFAPIVDEDNDGLLGMKYTETIPVLLKAIQELKAEIEILKNK